jgi:DNA-binding MurR/RpiR family transcriptional regulator
MHRLQYILLQILDQENPGSIDYSIALHILRYFEVLEGVSIQQLADACMVSKSTISRFCRKIGFEDYSEMVDELKNAGPSADHIFAYTAMSMTSEDLLPSVMKAVQSLQDTLDMEKIDQIAKDILTHERVYLMGSMQAYNPALNLQEDLALTGKIVFAPSLFTVQIDQLMHATGNDLFIVFSNSGNFFDRVFVNHENRSILRKPDIWMITGNNQIQEDDAVNHVLFIEDNDSYADHPLKFNLTANLIALKVVENIKAYEDKTHEKFLRQ